jgi:hypothetical protein
MHHLQWDAFILLLSIVAAVVLARLGVFAHLLTFAQSYQLASSFIAGIFFTSMFTVGISTVAFAEIGNSGNIVAIALAGAVGAVFGDMVLFLFIRDNLSADLKEILKKASYRRFIAHFHGGIFRWLSPILGALVIASPLPDELGLTLMGMSKMRSMLMIPITFVMNFLGILAILSVISHL